MNGDEPMKTTISRVLVTGLLLVLTLGLCSNAQAQRIPRIPRIRFNNGNNANNDLWHQGPRLVVYEKVPVELATKVMAVQGTTEVAFAYEQYDLMGWSLWTRQGHHILLVNGRQHIEPREDQWRSLIGGLPATKYGKPFWYRVQVWPLIISLFVAYKVTRRFVFSTKQEKIQRLRRDRRYQQALEVVFGSEEGDETLVTRLDDQRYQAAKNVLLDQGVSPNKADTNLQMLVNAELEVNNHQIDQEFQTGKALEERERWEDCVEHYAGLVQRISRDDDRRSLADERLEFARRMLTEA
ncbi:MAG: hypothetical protein ACKOBW_12135 [Planctomycetota bacterium]